MAVPPPVSGAVLVAAFDPWAVTVGELTATLDILSAERPRQSHRLARTAGEDSEALTSGVMENKHVCDA